ncbi:deoxyribonuclease V [Saccharibacillus alkalitolerans]|uniref:Endonuclease V n=1 Tax=Saccharibacillus alkalitolerans TaxID=2705290 RepID=A0ABX0FCA7_9BACL|nr:deoxyribonuclease V [Saccharibacillus alkalitolerans]NGZ77625.1 deoxyribonuclease V [Saccharibacillus alkalitolerans]
MQIVTRHAWNLNEQEAVSLQLELAAKISLRDPEPFDVRRIAGIDVAYDKDDDRLVAAVVVLDADTLDVVETAAAWGSPSFPYVPGLFSFRELPPVLEAFGRLKTAPDLIVCDGQGIAHPRRFGLASHLGLLLGIPSIGCGKTRLIGEYDEPAAERGSASPLLADGGELVGHVLRTQTGVKPVFVSPGHLISPDTACHWVLKLAPRYRLPETTRQADQLVRRELSRITQDRRLP